MALVNFTYPYFLWFLFLIPLFITAYFFGLIYNKKKSLVFANFEAVERFYGIEFFSKNFMALYLNLAVLILLVLGISGFGISYEGDASAYSFVFLIDNSKSMSANDIYPDRLSVAKSSAQNFIDELPFGVNLGVVGFSGSALVFQDLTTIKFKAKIGIDNINFGEVEGTNVYNALIAADKLFDANSNVRGRAVILISDGQSNIGDVDQIISFANRNNIIINTIGIGSEGGGNTQLNFVSKMDVDFLKSLAFNTKGIFSLVENETGFQESFDLISEKTVDIVNLDFSLYCFILAIILFTINWILFNLRFRVYP